jgi:hypothetical protein
LERPVEIPLGQSGQSLPQHPVRLRDGLDSSHVDPALRDEEIEDAILDEHGRAGDGLADPGNPTARRLLFLVAEGDRDRIMRLAVGQARERPRFAAHRPALTRQLGRALAQRINVLVRVAPLGRALEAVPAWRAEGLGRLARGRDRESGGHAHLLADVVGSGRRQGQYHGRLAARIAAIAASRSR